MLNDLTVDNLVVGGPAYTCKQLDRGDVILRVGVYLIVRKASPPHAFNFLLLAFNHAFNFLIYRRCRSGP